MALPAFQLTDANAAAIAELCRRLDGLPLAIELAALFALKLLHRRRCLARLSHRFQILIGGPSIAPGSPADVAKRDTVEL